MECTGKVKEISRGIDTNNFLVTLEVSDITLQELKAASEHEKYPLCLRRGGRSVLLMPMPIIGC